MNAYIVMIIIETQKRGGGALGAVKRVDMGGRVWEHSTSEKLNIRFKRGVYIPSPGSAPFFMTRLSMCMNGSISGAKRSGNGVNFNLLFRALKSRVRNMFIFE